MLGYVTIETDDLGRARTIGAALPVTIGAPARALSIPFRPSRRRANGGMQELRTRT